MVTRKPANFLPMKTAGTQHFIERTYRESGTFQWVRETFTNALEADATRVEFGIEWQAVESMGVYRRTIADNGTGMAAEELVEFFNTFGGGGKPIGGLHENFGVGSKTSLLPWNRYGMVVISWKDGEAAMIWVYQDPESGEFGLRLEEVEDPDTGEMSLDEVYGPYPDDDHGCDWASVKPDWLGDNGTVIVLLGNEPTDDTVLGDPSRTEADIKGISAYLNRRIWELPEGVEVYVDELRSNKRGSWPTSEAAAHGAVPKGGPDRRTNTRSIEGARHYIAYPPKESKSGKLAASGTVPMADGTEIDWFLWEGDRPAIQSYAAKSGYIAALYKNELYDISSHLSTYRSFGVSDQGVRQNLWLIARPPTADDARHGVYPRTDRNGLLLLGGPNAGGPLPFHDWAGTFADAMPDPVKAAIRAARKGEDGTIDDDTWRERLADRFGARWRIPKLRASKSGRHSVGAAQPGGATRPRKVRRPGSGAGSGGKGGTGGATRLGGGPGPARADKVKVAGGIPTYRGAGSEEFEHEYSLAAWIPNEPDHPEGVVLLNTQHPVLEAEIEHWQSQYPDPYSEDIAREVIRVYGEMAVAKIAHTEQLKGIIPSSIVDGELRSEHALTTGLLGIIGEEALIAPRVGGRFRKSKSA